MGPPCPRLSSHFLKSVTVLRWLMRETTSVSLKGCGQHQSQCVTSGAVICVLDLSESLAWRKRYFLILFCVVPSGEV